VGSGRAGSGKDEVRKCESSVWKDAPRPACASSRARYSLFSGLHFYAIPISLPSRSQLARRPPFLLCYLSPFRVRVRVWVLLPSRRARPEQRVEQ
jgi:hypothetical protein